MTRARLFIGSRKAAPDAIFIPSREETHYLRDVLRLVVGDTVSLVEPSGVTWRAMVWKTRPFTLRVIGMNGLLHEPSLEIVLLLPLLKSDRTELAIQKTVELGVKEIRVVVYERSVPRLLGRRCERLARVASEAARQCGRTSPVLSVHHSLSQALEGLPENRFYMDETAESGSITSLLLEDREWSKGVTLAVGPEGSFSPLEIETLRTSGFIPVRMGPRVLRAETAAIAAVVVVQAMLGDMR